MGGGKIKVLSVFGTRPETTKMAPLVKTLTKDERFESLVCVTAQHRGMLDQMLSAFEIKPDFDLDIMRAGQTLGDVTTRALGGLGEVFGEVKPDCVLVHGDTTTTFSAALAAFYAGNIKVGHVEAGLRTDNKLEPFPEEINRRLTDVLADFYFAPTETAKGNLLREGVSAEKIFVTGNTAVDAVRLTARDNYVFEDEALRRVDFSKKVVAVTAHRRENLGEPLREICAAIREIAEDKSIVVVYAVHANPAVRDVVFPSLGGADNIVLTDSLGVFDMHNLLRECSFVLTDSGGLQEEASSFGKPVVVLRNVTERPEGLKAGTLVLAGTEKGGIVRLARELALEGALYKKMAAAGNPYGDGFAAGRIAEALAFCFGKGARPRDFGV